MILHYFKIAVRNLLRDKFFSLINILGLAVGMGVCLLIYQYIHFELSYDRFHVNAQNTYRVTQTIIQNGEETGEKVYATYALGPRSKEMVPEIESFVRIHLQEEGPVVINPENNAMFQEDNVWHVDDSFLQMFDFQLKYGDRGSALKEKYQLVITEQAATKYFGDSDPVGKTLKFSLGSLSGDFVVKGVLKTLPTNSHLQFDFLLPIKHLLENSSQYKETSGWGWNNFVTYITINEATDPDMLCEKFDRVINTHVGERLAKSNKKLKTGLQPLVDIHLKSKYKMDIARNNGNMQDVRFFSIIAIFILFMAWVNYINLSTARSILRAKEVGIRKAIGALRKQLIGQFMMGSFLINFMAAMLAVGLALLLLPTLNSIIGKEIPFNALQNPEFWGWFSIIIILGTILSGLYPALVLSAFRPVSMLKSNKVWGRKGFSLRKGLIVFQFLISVLLISGTYLVYKQITFMKNKDLGIDMEKILVLNGPRVVLETLQTEGATLGSKYQVFKNKATGHYSVSSVSAIGTIPGKGYMWNGDIRRLGEPQESGRKGNMVIVDTDFTSTYEFEFLAGEKVKEDILDDKWVIINEQGVKVFGLGSPEDALHEHLINNVGDTLEVAGVVKNVHWSSLRDAHTPILFVLNNEYGAYFSIKMALWNIPETMAHLESAFHAVFPNDPFHYFFLDDDFNRQYQSDLQFGNLFSAFAILAIFIATLGLFALVSFSATLRVKEIGIRKVLGAGIPGLMILLSREYIILLLTANLIAVPVILSGSKAWLDNYAFRIGIGFELFLVPALVLIVISLLTVTYRTYATANANLIKSLRTE